MPVQSWSVATTDATLGSTSSGAVGHVVQLAR
jgi:hypothetical protein